MNTLEKRKLNLLVHLAHADGKFEKSEKELLRLFEKEKKLSASEHTNDHPLELSDFTHANDKIELLFWALRMMQADKIIHEQEVVFCKHLAAKLNFKSEVIDHYANQALPSFAEFESEVKRTWQIEK
jgi:uncharacterized tellurite resistance protein B-like protein